MSKLNKEFRKINQYKKIDLPPTCYFCLIVLYISIFPMGKRFIHKKVRTKLATEKLG